MPPISMLIKPASSSCNMRCEYCFYSDVTKRRSIKDYGIMSADTIEVIVKKAMEEADSSVSFGFQGGEPTLAGLDFFKETVRLQKKYNTKGLSVHNALQTNGYALTSEWAEFFKKEGFLIGLSMDGTETLHDKHRFAPDGGGTFKRVMQSAELLKEQGVDFNILSTVNIDIAKNPERIYAFFKKNGFRYLQFIPCLDGLDGERRDYSLTAKEYGSFLVKLFKLWSKDVFSSDPVSIRFFDNVVLSLCGYPPEECGMSGSCSCYYMIEADGSVYPCDFYVTDEWRLGNIKQASFKELSETEISHSFIKESFEKPQKCLECKFYKICRGGCKRQREPLGDKNGENKLCGGYYKFYSECMDELISIAKEIARRGRI